MKQLPGLATFVILLCGAAPSPAQFKPGNVFVSEPAGKRCSLGEKYGWDRIWEIDPYTGAVTLFAELRDNDCGYVTGLALTPDGCGLRASQLLASRIIEFTPDGSWMTVLGIDDGIIGPWGSNNLAYDRDGNFYVVNHSARSIVKFPADGGPGVVFADQGDGVRGAGPVAIASDGELYFGNTQFEGYVLRLTPVGEVSLFDALDGFRFDPSGLASDNHAHVFMATNIGDVYRYDVANGSSRTLLAQFGRLSGSGTIAIASSQTWLHRTSRATNQLTAIQTTTGEEIVLAEVPLAQKFSSFGGGIAVAPVINGDHDRSGEVNLRDLESLPSCFAGPQIGPASFSCSALDLDGDADIDLGDFAVFQREFGKRASPCP